jgi:hypothetical protein
MKSIKYSLTLFLLTILAFSCRKIESLPPEPYIEFTNFAVFDTTDILGNSYKGGKLKFYFEDGDGDLGIPQPSEGGTEDTINLFMTLYRKVDGSMIPVADNDPLKPPGFRIPYMERPGQNKILKGTIAVTFLYLFYSPDDSAIIKYNFYVKDRADNQSNTEATNEISLSVNDVYD